MPHPILPIRTFISKATGYTMHEFPDGTRKNAPGSTEHDYKNAMKRRAEIALETERKKKSGTII